MVVCLNAALTLPEGLGCELGCELVAPDVGAGDTEEVVVAAIVDVVVPGGSKFRKRDK